MPEASNKQAILRENLKDAGCDPDMIHRCEALVRGEKRGELIRVLSLHRRALLDAVHENDLYDGGRKDAIPFDKLAEFFETYLR